ncbi:MAG TPA: hypothetical protein VG294_19575 [Solirubrobacteraceae bacterium]|jgi:hypothetical protein|nr:hypothetical protein [Solirubrobacteraceae bacterium]
MTNLTPLDESYRHQLVAPAVVTEHLDPGWAERCYHLLNIDGATILHAGRAVYPHDGRRTAFAGVGTGAVQHALRLSEPFATGDDPDRPTVGRLRIEAVRPLEEVRLVLDEPGFPLAFDLTFHARFPPVPTIPNRIERGGRVVTDYMNLFQSGMYTGTVVIDGAERTLAARAGFRDRGWGLRKHEGSPRRGLVVAAFCELDDAAVYVMLYETAAGHRAFTNGWLLDRRGVVETVTSIEHDLSWDRTLLTGGTLELAFGSGSRRTVELTVTGRIFLSAAGYTASTEAARPGAESFDVTNLETVSRLNGQNDNACTFSVDGVIGHGYVETGLGIHARYRPEAPGAEHRLS